MTTNLVMEKLKIKNNIGIELPPLIMKKGITAAFWKEICFKIIDLYSKSSSNRVILIIIICLSFLQIFIL